MPQIFSSIEEWLLAFSILVFTLSTTPFLRFQLVDEKFLWDNKRSNIWDAIGCWWFDRFCLEGSHLHAMTATNRSNHVSRMTSSHGKLPLSPLLCAIARDAALSCVERYLQRDPFAALWSKRWSLHGVFLLWNKLGVTAHRIAFLFDQCNRSKLVQAPRQKYVEAYTKCSWLRHATAASIQNRQRNCIFRRQLLQFIR